MHKGAPERYLALSCRMLGSGRTLSIDRGHWLPFDSTMALTNLLHYTSRVIYETIEISLLDVSREVAVS
jgi:hypothetical protein